MKQEMMEFWDAVDHMQTICTSLHRQITTPTPHHSIFTGRMLFLMPNQQCQRTKGNTHTYTHPFNGPLSETTWVSQYQKNKTNVDFNEARDSDWQWHHLGHMQVCTSL